MQRKVCYSMVVRTQRHSGFSLIEIVFTMTLVLVLAGLSLWTLRPANSKAPSRGLALAVAEELGAARQLAISTGHPVALGIPADASPLASSIYRLEGWNIPTVTWSKGFAGDYPNCGFAAAKWTGGGTWTNGAPESVVSKALNFDMAGQWLPTSLQDDYIFCFTPDGGLVTNSLPALDGRYTVVVGQYLDISGGTVNAAKDPVTIFVSPYGAIEVVTGMPGSNVPQSGSGGNVTSAPVQRTDFLPGEVRLSKIKVAPAMDQPVPGVDGFCVPGQYVTMEVYAYDPEGRGLFAKWKQGPQKGIFTYPDGGAPAGSVLETEVDRMEYVDQAPAGLEWPADPPPPGGLFRARWGWTVPPNSVPGTVYEITVDVKDVNGDIQIAHLPPKLVMRTAPKGRIVAEKLINGIWQIVQFNPDGSGEALLSPVGVPESMPSIDRSGTRMALLQGNLPNRYVKVRALDGGFEKNISGAAGPFTSVAISPDGAWVSYRNNTTNELITVKVDGSDSHTFPQSWIAGSGVVIKKSRSGFSQDSHYLIYENQATLRICQLGNWGSDTEYLSNTHTTDDGTIAEQLYAPISYVTPDGDERVMFSLGNHNPVLVSVPWTPGSPLGSLSCFNPPMLLPDLNGGGGGSGSSTYEDDYPSVSQDGTQLILNRSPFSDGATEDVADQELWIAPWDGGVHNYVGPPIKVSLGNVRRAAWIPEPKP